MGSPLAGFGPPVVRPRGSSRLGRGGLALPPRPPLFCAVWGLLCLLSFLPSSSASFCLCGSSCLVVALVGPVALFVLSGLGVRCPCGVVLLLPLLAPCRLLCGSSADRSSSVASACAGASVVVCLGFLFPWAWCPSLGCSFVWCRLGFAMSLSSFVSSLPVVGPVSVPSVRSAAESVVRRLFALPGASASAPVVVVSVVRGADRVSVACGDGRVRVCRVATASRALGRPVSVDAVFAKLSARVGQPVSFFAVEGWSPDSWFVGCVGSELLGKE